MDVGLIILGMLILFGATILFKAAGFTGGEEASSALEKAGGSKQAQMPAQKTDETQQAVMQQQSEKKPADAKKRCKNCLAENFTDAKFCVNCGSSFVTSEIQSVFQKQQAWIKMHGWSKNPFTLDVIPSLFVGYKKEISEVMEKIASGSGHILVVGDIGTGKTTLLRWLELNMPSEYHTLYVFRPPERFDKIIELMVSSAGIKEQKQEYTIYNLNTLMEKLKKRFILMMDEAHEFKADISEPLKTLGDVSGVTLVMAGLPKLDNNLKKESAPLYDRLVAKVGLGNLSEGNTKMLITKRIEHAGGWGIEPFTEEAIAEVYKTTKGQPRGILKLCDAAVTEAIREGILVIDEKIVQKAKNAMTG
ncbi:MAG: AAA family ATPase [Candidatus Altiarchaeota archaeon]